MERPHERQVNHPTPREIENRRLLEEMHPEFVKTVHLEDGSTPEGVLGPDTEQEPNNIEEVAKIKATLGPPTSKPGDRRHGPTDTEVFIANRVGVSPRKLPYSR